MGRVGHKWKMFRIAVGLKKPKKKEEPEPVPDPDEKEARKTEVAYKGEHIEDEIAEDGTTITVTKKPRRPSSHVVHHHNPAELYQLVAIDLDGTLLNDDGVISNFTKDTIVKLQDCGVKICLMTGRSIANCYQYVIRLGITCVVVACNGSFGCIVEKDGCQATPDKALFSVPIEYPDVLKVMEFSKEVGVVAQYYAGDFVYNNSSEEKHYHGSRYYTKKTKTVLEFINDDFQEAMTFSMPNKMVFLSHKKEELDALDRLIIKELPHIVIVRGCMGGEQELFFLEIVHGDVNKGTGLEKVCNELEVSVTNVIAFGDSDNDIEMLETAGRGVAMMHCTEACGLIADEVLEEGNNEDAVAKKLLGLLEAKQFVFPPPPPQEDNNKHPEILKQNANVENIVDSGDSGDSGDAANADNAANAANAANA